MIIFSFAKMMNNGDRFLPSSAIYQPAARRIAEKKAPGSVWQETERSEW